MVKTNAHFFIGGHLISLWFIQKASLFFFACFHFGCCSHDQVTWAPLTFTPCKYFPQIPPLKGFDFKKRPFAVGNSRFLCLCFPTCVLGRGSVGRTAVLHPGVWEQGLACFRVRLIVRKGGRERGDRDARNCITSTTATAQEKGAKEIYICLPINLNLDTGRSQRTVIYELSKPEKFLLTLYFQLLHAFLQDDSVIL